MGTSPRWGRAVRRVPVTVHVQPGTHDWAYAMSALRYSFTFLTDNWRQAAADSGSGPPG